MSKIFIYGASGHGLVVADIALKSGYRNVIFIDDGKNEFPTFDDIKDKKHIPIALGIGDNLMRAKIFDKIISEGFTVKSLMHPTATISKTAKIEIGTVVMPNVVINAKAMIGKGVILNTGCIIEHECKIGNFAHISPNAALAGKVEIGNFTHIGIGSSIIQSIHIGSNCIIGAGSVVVNDINNYQKAYGNPCKEIENLQL